METTANDKIFVDVDEIARVKRFLRAINNTEFDAIVWTREGNPLFATYEFRDEFRFMGLNNTDFPGIAGWIEDGLWEKEEHDLGNDSEED